MNGPRNPAEAAYRRNRTNECPPVAVTTEGASIAVGANAPSPYPPGATAGKPSPRTLKYAQNTREGQDYGNVPRTAYRASTGRIWAFTGKRGRVLELLATRGQGLTQWDCWPWHTRLGASIHVLREAGLVIDTLREGEYRHARYFLRTPGTLIIQAKNSGGGQ